MRKAPPAPTAAGAFLYYSASECRPRSFLRAFRADTIQIPSNKEQERRVFRRGSSRVSPSVRREIIRATVVASVILGSSTTVEGYARRAGAGDGRRQLFGGGGFVEAVPKTVVEGLHAL